MDGAWHWVSCLGKRPSRRTETDLDIIMSRMKTMVVFEGYPEMVLQELCRVVLYDTHLANTTLFRPGENGMYWYVVVSGTLEMLYVDPHNSQKTTLICQLQSGDSFGENVVLEATRETMVVTKTYCELLYVEADNMRRIYETHKDVMENLLHPRGGVGLEEVDGEEGGGGGGGWIFPQSELALAGATVREIINSNFTNLLSDHRVNMYTYKSCCSGGSLVDWVIAQSAIPRTRQQVTQMWQALLLEGVLQHSHKVHPFLDDPQLFYKFTDMNGPSDSSPTPVAGGRLQQFMNLFSFSRNSTPVGSPAASPVPRKRENVTNGRPRSASSVGAESHTSRGSIDSVLEECFDTVSRLSPEVLILATLAKEPLERTEEDKNMIYEELLNVRALRHLTNAVKREVAACVRLQHHSRPGQYLFHQGEKGDSWYVVLKGSVNVIIKGKGVVCTLHEGDDFGKLSLLTAGERSASIRTREPNSYFLQIERDDFRRILLSVEDSTMKITHRGREVMHLQRETAGSYSVIRGTPERMLDHLVGSEVNTTQEGSFAHDFFLTHVAFMSMEEVCSGLIARYREKKKENEDDEEEEEVVTVTRKKRIAKSVAVWINVAKSQLVKDAVFLGLLKELQDGMEVDELTEELEVLNISLSESIRSAILGKHTHSPILSGGINQILGKGRGKGSLEEPRIKLGICSVPPAQPQDMEEIIIQIIGDHTHTHCALTVRLDAKAIAIKDEVCKKKKLPKFKYQLCEVTSSGQKKVIREENVSVASELSVNGRLFLFSRTHSQRIVDPLPEQIKTPSLQFPEDLPLRELAAHLTLYDWNLFSNTQQMEVIYHVFGRHKFGKIVTNLDLLLRRFIEVKFWVVTTMCMEQDLIKRVALLKKFIKLAGYCKGHSNVNSFLAIVLALSNPAVSRMKQTWKELAPKMKRRFDSFDAITDPSRNQKVLRAYQSKLPRPVIPFMPLVMKDMAFLHEGNETMIEGLVNFEKMRLLAEKVRSLFEFRTGSLSNDIRLLANKNSDLQKYIRNIQVVDNQQILTKMSHSVEPTVRPASITA